MRSPSIRWGLNTITGILNKREKKRRRHKEGGRGNEKQIGTT